MAIVEPETITTPLVTDTQLTATVQPADRTTRWTSPTGKPRGFDFTKPAAQQGLDLVEAEKQPAAYVPPTEYEDRERVVCTGERGAILNAYLYTPEWQGEPDGPTRITLFTEPGSEGELDYPSGVDILRQLDTFRGRLAVMVAALAPEQEAPPAVPPSESASASLTDAAVDLAKKAVSASLAGLQTNPRDVAARLHRAIDNAQGWHLAEITDQAEVTAYADSRLATAIDAMHDALGAAEQPARMARALRNALDMVISEAGQ